MKPTNPDGLSPGQGRLGKSLADLMARVRSSVPWTGPAEQSVKPGALLFLKPPAEVDFLIQWLVAAQSGGQVMLVPVDDNPLAGPGDCRLAQPPAPWPMVARCGLSTWVPSEGLAATTTGHLSDGALHSVHMAIRFLSDTGPATGGESDWDSADPELLRHMDLVQLCIDEILARSSAPKGGNGQMILRFTRSDANPGVPPEYKTEPMVLAAAGSWHLMDELRKIERGAEAGSFTLEHPLSGTLTLVLVANEEGVRPAIRGSSPEPVASRIRDLSNGGCGVSMEWEQTQGLLVSRGGLAWRDGKVCLGLPNGTVLELSR